MKDEKTDTSPQKINYTGNSSKMLETSAVTIRQFNRLSAIKWTIFEIDVAFLESIISNSKSIIESKYILIIHFNFGGHRFSTLLETEIVFL